MNAFSANSAADFAKRRETYLPKMWEQLMVLRDLRRTVDPDPTRNWRRRRGESDIKVMRYLLQISEKTIEVYVNIFQFKLNRFILIALKGPARTAVLFWSSLPTCVNAPISDKYIILA